MDRNTVVYGLTILWLKISSLASLTWQTVKETISRNTELHYKSWGKKWYLHYWSLLCENHINCCALDLVQDSRGDGRAMGRTVPSEIVLKTPNTSLCFIHREIWIHFTNQNFLEESVWELKMRWKIPVAVGVIHRVLCHVILGWWTEAVWL